MVDCSYAGVLYSLCNVNYMWFVQHKNSNVGMVIYTQEFLVTILECSSDMMKMSVNQNTT